MNVLKLKEVREKVSKLRTLKAFGTLNEEGHIHLTTLEMLLEYSKRNEFDEFMSGLCKKNGTTNY